MSEVRTVVVIHPILDEGFISKIMVHFAKPAIYKSFKYKRTRVFTGIWNR